MCILVTGAAGFIGYHTSRALLNRGDEIIAFDNLNAYYDVRLKEARLDNLRPRNGFQFIRGDLADRAAVERLFEVHRPKRVIHLAAQAGVCYSLSHPEISFSGNR